MRFPWTFLHLPQYKEHKEHSGGESKRYEDGKEHLARFEHDSDRKTPNSNCKLQATPIIREDSPHEQTSKSLAVLKM